MKKTYTILMIVSVLTIVFVLGYFAFKNYNEKENDDNWLNSSGDIEIDTGFNDVSNEYWAKEYILYLAQRDIMSGDASGNFNPENKMSCREFLMALSKASMPMINYSKISENDLIKILIDKNVIKEDEITNEILDSEVTNYYAAIMMAKFDINIRNEEQKIMPIKYTDIGDLSDTYKTLIAHSVKRGFIKVKDSSKFNPNNTLSRAKVAEIVYIFMNAI